MSRTRKVAIIAIGIIIVLVLLAGPVWERICGNSRIAFYGQVVDESGKGIPGVQINFDILYSDEPARLVMFGRVERKRRDVVTTDAHGDFGLKGVYGYSVRFAPAKYDGKEWG